ncbi:MAG: four helix bundle protein [Bacteroidales bacterium]|nr:four helix bundle protein [Bacteroidales bacterium]MCF8404636.1 four helix bundle protein [Bacteroidales bacterium]
MDNETTQNGTFFRFEDLRVYHKTLDYIDWVYNAANQLPTNCSSVLSKKFIHSAQAISFYIAEGSSRNKSQFIYYLKMAKSSVRECVVLTSIAEKQNLFNQIQVDESRNELMEMTKMLGALIGSLQKSNGKNGNRSKPNYRDKNQENYKYEDSDDLLPFDTVDSNHY